ncbi:MULTISPECIES: replication initiation protein RepC [unclassified Rhizobium]
MGYKETYWTMGLENAAVAMACVLEREGMINSSGVYLRNLTRRSEHVEYSLYPMPMALLKTQRFEGRRAVQ